MCDDAGCARRAALPSCLILLSFAVGGCAADLRDPDGIDELPLLELIEEQRIGSVDDPDLGFSRLYAADVDRDGNVFALDGLDVQIRVYAPDGTLLRRIGRRGGGPGEFEDAPRYGLKGDTLWAFDMGSGRITFFDRTGQVLATGRTEGLRLPVRTGWGYVLPLTMGADGLLVGWFARVSYPRDNPPPEVTGDERVPRVRFDVSGAVVDTVGWTPGAPPRMVPPPDYDRGRYRSITVGGERYSVPDPPTELAEWLPAADGYFVVHMPSPTGPERGTLTVTRLANAGDTVYHRVLTYHPQPYTDEQLDSIAGQQPRGWMNGVEMTRKVDATARAALRAAMDYPNYRQAVQYAWLANDETVWLRRSTEPGQPARWIILEPDGTLRGEVDLPARSRPLWSRDGTLWSSVSDEMDVPWLVRYRIAR